MSAKDDARLTRVAAKSSDFIIKVIMSVNNIIINMSNNNRSSYSYYDYIKNYNSKFLNKY